MVKANELDALARTLWGEARSESPEGKIAVAWVIRNRVNKPSWWGKTILSVIHKPWQFSCWNKSDPNYKFLSGQRKIPQKEYDECAELALKVFKNEVEDPTNGATHYFAPKVVKAPSWTKGAKLTVTIGGHKFYKDVP